MAQNLKGKKPCLPIKAFMLSEKGESVNDYLSFH